MKAAIVHGPGQPPVYGIFEDPRATPGANRVTVTAAAISPLARSRASGSHYSASNAYPFIAGIDGTGRLDDGQRVYFVLPQAPYGSMAERTLVPAAQCLPLPDDINDATAAAIANPGMSSWAAFTERARLAAGETVLINGSTGVAGRLAVQIARHFGAAKVIATGRDRDALHQVALLGADVTLVLDEDDATLESRLQDEFAAGVDVVIDYLWGKSARQLLVAGARAGEAGRPIRVVQIGAASGPEIALPAAVLRASAIEMMGSGIGSIPLARLVGAIDDLLRAAVPAGFAITAIAVPLIRVEEVWQGEERAGRIVLTPNAPSP